MGAELSKSGLDFVTYFSTATQITAEDVSRGVAALDTTFVSAIAVGAPTPVTTDAISASLEALFFNAVDNNRLGVGIDYARRQLDQTTAGQDGSGPADTAAAVRFAQCLITLAMARAEGGPFLLKKLIDSNGEATGLHNAAIAYVVANVKVTTTAQLRLTAEVLLLLQTLYSSALYHPALVGSIGGDAARDPHADTFLDAVATSTDPAMTKLYGIGLLHLVCEWAAGVGAATVSLTEYPPKDKPRLFNLYNMFGMAKRGSRLAISTIVGVRALHIFALLATYRKPGRPQPCMLTQFKAGKGPFGEAAGAPSASELLNVIAAKIDTCQELILILYLLCCHHPDAVKAAVTPNEDGVAAVDNIAVGQILTGIAKAEYNSVASSGIAPIAFLCGSVLLLLSRDTPSLPRWFSAATSAAAPWYAERYVGSISAGSLVVMVTARTVARAVAMSNHDVADMHLGFLANVAPFVHSLHTLAAQRLVSCLRHMLKRLAKAQSEVTRDSNNYEAIATLERLESHCATAMDVMLAILDGASRDNLSLLYDLLHQKSEIFGITSQWNPGTQIADAAAPLAKLISFHEAELSSFANNPNHTVEEVMQVIKKVADDVSAPDIVVGALPSSRQADASGIALCEANLFEYDEDENSYEFFAPLIWRAVLATSGSVLVLPGPRIAATIRLLRSDPAVESREGGHAV